MRRGSHVLELLDGLGFRHVIDDDNTHRFLDPNTNANLIMYIPHQRLFRLGSPDALPRGGGALLWGDAQLGTRLNAQEMFTLWARYAYLLTQAGIDRKHTARAVYLHIRTYNHFGRDHARVPYTLSEFGIIASLPLTETQREACITRGLSLDIIQQIATGNTTHGGLLLELYPPLPAHPENLMANTGW